MMRSIFWLSGLCVASSLAAADQFALGDPTEIPSLENAAFHSLEPERGPQMASDGVLPGSCWSDSAPVHVAAGIVAVARGRLYTEQE